MCHATRCTTCNKTTWTGCGRHVDDVKRTVPAANWCPGHDDPHNDGWLRHTLFR